MIRRVLLLALGIVAFASASGCARKDVTERPLVLGFFPNVTHAQALVAFDERRFRAAVPDLEVKQFNAGPAAMEALLAGEVDVAFVGSGPAINAFVRSEGNVHIIAGAASGGAVLVAKTATRPEDLKGKRVAAPQLANTQDIAFRHWLSEQGLETTEHPGGTVAMFPVTNADIVNLYERGTLEAAWVPEPWGAKLLEKGAHILVDERDLWPRRKFPATVMVATDAALAKRRDDVKKLLEVHVKMTEEARKDPPGFARRANEAFGKLTRKPLSENVLQDAFSRLELSTEILEAELVESARHARELGYLPTDDVSGVVDRTLLDELRPPLPTR